jgi:zinc transporter
MVSIRLWIDDKRVISLRLRRLLSIVDLRESIDRGHGPSDVGDFVVQLTDRMVSRISSVITDVDDKVDELQDQMHLREEADRIVRYVEDLDAARERATVTQEELSNRISEQMNARMYVLSVVAAIFLPLGFLTGLFGVNVGGIPMADDPRGFLEMVLVLLLMTGLQVMLFRWRRWL